MLTEPAELVWLRLGLHRAGRDLNTVLQVDRFTFNSYTEKNVNKKLIIMSIYCFILVVLMIK